MSELETRFFQKWIKLHPFIELCDQYKFSNIRKFRADFAHIESKTLIEIQGGIWSNAKSGHNSGTGLERDFDKICQAQMEGWSIFLLSSNMINKGYLDKIAFTIKDRLLNESGCKDLCTSEYAYIIHQDQCIRLRRSIKNNKLIWLKDKIVKKSKKKQTLEKTANTLAQKRNAVILPENSKYFQKS